MIVASRYPIRQDGHIGSFLLMDKYPFASMALAISSGDVSLMLRLSSFLQFCIEHLIVWQISFITVG